MGFNSGFKGLKDFTALCGQRNAQLINVPREK